jgi:hypothetical protein
MVQSPTLIFTPRHSEDSQALWKAASNLGWNTERLASWRVPEHLKTLANPVLYAEALMAPMLAEQLGLALTHPPEEWLVTLPMQYKHRNIRLCTLGEARSSSEAAFVKPPNDKSLPAGVYLGRELPTEYDEQMSVLVSDVVTWEKEFRCFVLDRALKTYSIYSRHGELQRENEFFSTEEENQQVEAFMRTLLADDSVTLPRAAVVDIGTIEGRGWACVEQNAAWGAGIYGCDARAVLQVLALAQVAKR